MDFEQNFTRRYGEFCANFARRGDEILTVNLVRTTAKFKTNLVRCNSAAKFDVNPVGRSAVRRQNFNVIPRGAAVELNADLTRCGSARYGLAMEFIRPPGAVKFCAARHGLEFSEFNAAARCD